MPLPTIGDFAANTDSLGRTQVLGTSTIAAPSLQQFVSVMDAPWGAKGDAQQATTGAITAAASTLTGVGAITTANTGQAIMVIGAGANITQGGSGPTVAGPLNAFIGTVSGGNISLVTTSGGSTPATATFTVSGATVRWGTDDTTAFNSAMLAVSNRATATGTPGSLLVPSGYSFIVGNSVPKNNVSIWAYGATFYLNYANSHAMFESSFIPITGFSIRGANFAGANVEAVGQLVFITSMASVNSAMSFDLGVYDTTVTNWSAGVYYFQNVARGRAINNRMNNVCANNGHNAINWVTTGLNTADSTREIICTHNTIEGCATECITLVNAATVANSYLTQTVPIRVIFTDNICEAPTGNGTPLTLEFSLGLTGHQSKVIVANNTATYSGSATSNCFGLIINDTSAATPTQSLMAGAGNPDPEFLNRIIVSGNVVESTCWGLQVACSEATVYGNVVNITGTPGIAMRVGKLSNTMTFVGDVANSSATISNVTSANANIVNGAPLSGSNIANGAFLLTGAGTSTYTMSTPATGTATSQTTNASPQNKNMVVSNNVIHVSSATSITTQHLFDITNLRNSTISYNRTFVDSGIANVACYGMRFFRCGWMDISHNSVNGAPQYGIYIDSCNDWTLAHNRIHNPSAGLAGWSGIVIQNLAPNTIARVESNVIFDDRPVHLMSIGLNMGSAGFPVIEALFNEIHGYTTSAASGLNMLKAGRGNLDDTHTSDVTVITATNATWPMPIATQLRFTCIGGGGGGGGGGSPGTGSPVTNQVGGAGGSAGATTQAIVLVGTATTLAVTIGGGGGGGGGGSAGNAGAGTVGSQGTGGTATTITGTGISVGADGGGRGLGAAANSTTTVSSVTTGSGGVTALPGTLGTGGQATAANGIGGSPGLDYTAGGGGGGGPSSATLGGLGGTVGVTGRGSANVGIGGAGTAAGVNGTTGTTSMGGGGGGGGGGAWNGSASGAGGTGGTGGAGLVIVEVLG